MKLKPFLAFKSKFIKPCSKILSIFTLKFNRHSFSLKPSRFRRRRFKTKVVRFRKPFSIKALRIPRCHPRAKLRFRRPGGRRLRFRRRRPPAARIDAAPAPNGERFGERIAELMSVFKSARQSNELGLELELEHVMDLKSVSDTGNGVGKEPFPSPITPAFVRAKKESSEESVEEMEDTCRSFEGYLMEMIVEDGKIKDLMDVEDLLKCLRSLKSPVFAELVSEFYGELCKDLFIGDEEETSASDQ